LKILIVGVGKVGYVLAENLSNEGHEITVIDTSGEALGHANDTLDILPIKGNGASVSVLKSAGVEKADVVIAVSNRDELNMLCCLIAKKLGAKYTIARIRDYEYAIEVSRLKKELDIDMVVNPEYATATQISRLIRFPVAVDIDTFYRGRIELVGFRVLDGDIITGEPLYVVRKRLKNIPILFCAVNSEGETFIPHGNTVLKPGDTVYVIGNVVGIDNFFRTLGRIRHKIKNAFIVGGGRITFYLAQYLTQMNIDVKIVETDHDTCRYLCESLPKALVVHGDGTDQDLLESERLQSADAFVALTGRDEDNLITSLYAKQVGVPKVISKINRQNYYGIVDQLMIDSIVSPKLITAYAILHSVRAMLCSDNSPMESLYQIASGGAEAMVFTVSDKMKHLKTPLRDLRLKKGVLIALINRGGQFIIPEGSDHIEQGDSIIIVTSGMPLYDINDIYED